MGSSYGGMGGYGRMGMGGYGMGSMYDLMIIFMMQRMAETTMQFSGM
eukprot:gene41140-47946_t